MHKASEEVLDIRTHVYLPVGTVLPSDTDVERWYHDLVVFGISSTDIIQDDSFETEVDQWQFRIFSSIDKARGGRIGGGGAKT